MFNIRKLTIPIWHIFFSKRQVHIFLRICGFWAVFRSFFFDKKSFGLKWFGNTGIKVSYNERFSNLVFSHWHAVIAKVLWMYVYWIYILYGSFVYLVIFLEYQRWIFVLDGHEGGMGMTRTMSWLDPKTQNHTSHIKICKYT